MADSPKVSEYTSVKSRIDPLKENKATAPCLHPFVGPTSIPFRLMDYLELVGWRGRHIRNDKRGHTSNTLPPILNRLGISQETWLEACTELERENIIGKEESIKRAPPTLKRKQVSEFRLPR
ncbi:hypothetical protein GCM10007932_28080 [Vibrio penaeicida]|uniref:Transposase n=1 Tax=Vibrio penaeicida TaxID=104609 RepID=A0AAV5NT94_9VIBR|nr:hypothetical protein GCM10007932_28080 [Vibrio penaeicida]